MISGRLAFQATSPRHETVDAIDLVIKKALEDSCEPNVGIDVVHSGIIRNKIVSWSFPLFLRKDRIIKPKSEMHKCCKSCLCPPVVPRGSAGLLRAESASQVAQNPAHGLLDI